MRKQFLLAIPLASLLFLAGCSTCNSSKGCGTVAVTPASAVKPAVVNAEEGAVAYAVADESAPQRGIATGVHSVGSSIEQALHLAEADTPTSDKAIDPNVETITAEEYQALIASGKVTDTTYRAPGSVEAVPASIPSRFQSMTGQTEIAVASRDVPIRSDELVTPAILNAAALREAKAVSASTDVATTAVVSSSIVPKIPGMPLPDGWDYINEKDLGVALDTIGTVADKHYFSDATRALANGDVADI